MKTVKMDIPAAAAPAIKELLEELVDHWKNRPYAVRDAAQAWGLVGEEWDEFKREVRHTDVGDSLDAVIHDLCDIAKIAIACYIDLTAQQTNGADRGRLLLRKGQLDAIVWTKGGLDVVCMRCFRRQAWHRRGYQCLCQECVS